MKHPNETTQDFVKLESELTYTPAFGHYIYIYRSASHIYASHDYVCVGVCVHIKGGAA